MITGQSPEKIRSMFSIKNDFTLEEEKKLRAETDWVMGTTLDPK